MVLSSYSLRPSIFSSFGHVDLGYLAYSDDYGKTWTEVKKSPWKKPSVFRVLMFINMGKNFSLNKDGYVYALGMGSEAAWTKDEKMDGRKEYEERTIYLARVPNDKIINYQSYEYFTGLKRGGKPHWSRRESDAKPLKGIESIQTGSAMFHKGTKKYLFLTASPGALFAAPKPWGPWKKVASLFHDGKNPAWKKGGYIPGVIAKGAGPKHFYFTLAGGVEHYILHIGKIELDVKVK